MSSSGLSSQYEARLGRVIPPVSLSINRNGTVNIPFDSTWDFVGRNATVNLPPLPPILNPIQSQTICQTPLDGSPQVVPSNDNNLCLANNTAHTFAGTTFECNYAIGNQGADTMTNCSHCGLLGNRGGNTIQSNNTLTSRSCTVERGDNNTITAGDECSIADSSGCAIETAAASTGRNTECRILASQGSTINDINNLQSSLCTIQSSLTSTISGGVRCVISDCVDSTIAGAAGATTNSFLGKITACRNCTITHTGSGPNTRNHIHAGEDITLTNCTETVATGFNQTISGTEMTSVAGRANTVTGCERTDVHGFDNTVDNSNECVVSGRDHNVTNTTRSQVAGAGMAVTGCNRVVAFGSFNNITGVQNSYAFYADVSGNNTYGIGVDTFFVADGNAEIRDGYAWANQGFIISTATGTTTVAADTNSIYLENGETVTLPVAATFGGNFPTGYSKKITVFSEDGSTGNEITLSGSDTFRKRPGWTKHELPDNGSSVEVIFYNHPVLPFWTFPSPVVYGAYFEMTTNNNFGVTPPQSDAAQLPTAANFGEHVVIGPAGRISFDNKDSQPSDNTVFERTADGFIQINVTGRFAIEYQWEFSQAASAGNATFTSRGDLVDTATDNTLPDSFTAQGGWADTGTPPSKMDKTVKAQNIAAGTIFTVRISQGTGQTANTDQDLRRVQVRILGTF